MPRYFKVAGPCVPDKHYLLPTNERCAEINVIRNGTAVGAITLSANAFNAFKKTTTFFEFLNFPVAFFLSFSKNAPSPHRLTLPVGGR
jgi:hypothetical protein